MPRRVTAAGLGTAFIDVALAAMYVLFALAHVRSFLLAPRASVLLIVVLETSFAACFLVRRQTDEVTLTPASWLSSLAGTFVPLLLRPSAGGQDLLIAQLVQTAGMAFALYGLLSLNRSFGLIPANRGIRTVGAYRWVRHPLYAGYTLVNLGYLANNPDASNAVVFLVALLAQLVRIHHEERLLLRDPVYARYAERTRWRLLPLVF